MLTHPLTRRLLIPLDGSDLGAVTVPHLRALACVESELLLLHVIGPDPAAPDGHTAASARAWLQAIAGELDDVTPRIRVLVREGAAPDEIIRVAEEERVDLILMPSRGLGATPNPLIGSVASRVAEASTTPVMLIHAQHGDLPLTIDQCASYRRVIVPLDGSPRSREALTVARQLVCRHNLPMRLLHAAPKPVPAGTRRILDAEAERMRALGIDCDVEIVTQQVVPAILAAAGPGDIIVMTSHGAGGVRHWLMGGVAEKVVAMARTPVVLVPVGERRALTRPVQAPELAETPASRAAQRLPAVTVAMGS
jgi:nucleotide-binding universal stress UspA family protein